jgi:hypothetical protein
MAYSSDRWRQIEGLFYEAVELTPDARSEFLDRKCEGDAELRKEVESLIASAEQPMDFLHKPVQKAARHVMTDDRCEMMAAGTLLTHYKIVSMIGAEGWARCTSPRTHVSGARSRSNDGAGTHSR